jgi:hypothetical protein
MKQYAVALLILMVIYSCAKPEPKKELGKIDLDKKELDKKEKQRISYEIADAELLFQKKKIVLLSEIKGVPYDTLYHILRDYYSKTLYSAYLSLDSSRFICEIAIDSVSKNYHISRYKIASLIFSFKYEMRSKEDIINEGEQEQDDTSY